MRIAVAGATGNIGASGVATSSARMFDEMRSGPLSSSR